MVLAKHLPDSPVHDGYPLTHLPYFTAISRLQDGGDHILSILRGLALGLSRPSKGELNA